MAHRAHKIAGPMLRDRDAKGNKKTPASPEDVVIALHKAKIPFVVVREWENEAKRRHGLKGSEERRGRDWRIDYFIRYRLDHRQKPQVKKLSLRQRLARRISRLFRKH